MQNFTGYSSRWYYSGMHKIEVAHISAGDNEWVFKVVVDDAFNYTVMVPRSYYETLTSGKIPPEDLVKHSFDFLLEHESPEEILPEFSLPTIQKFFPKYEEEISSGEK
jgi:hypothetical protein